MMETARRYSRVPPYQEARRSLLGSWQVMERCAEGRYGGLGGAAGDVVERVAA